MNVTDIRKTKRVRALAVELRERCALHGMTLVDGEAEDILAARIGALARQLRVTERTVMDSYLPEGFIPELARAVAAVNEEYQDVASDAGPVTLSAAEAGHVIAALGMTTKLAVAALGLPEGRTEALGVATDTADAIVGIGALLRGAEGQPIQVGGSTLVYTRKVLRQTIELIRDGTWICPCRSRHTRGASCDLQRNLASDLSLVGGWASGGATEPPAADR
jgi:hypothetical protein